MQSEEEKREMTVFICESLLVSVWLSSVCRNERCPWVCLVTLTACVSVGRRALSGVVHYCASSFHQHVLWANYFVA